MAEIDKIYILKKKKYMYGPYTTESLKQNVIKQGDMIWYEGLKDWQPVEEIDFFAKFIGNSKDNNEPKKSFFKKLFGL
jgi:hypothetical protein